MAECATWTNPFQGKYILAETPNYDEQISEMHGVILPEKAQTNTLTSIWGCIISTNASEAVSDQHHNNVKFEHEKKSNRKKSRDFWFWWVQTWKSRTSSNNVLHVSLTLARLIASSRSAIPHNARFFLIFLIASSGSLLLGWQKGDTDVIRWHVKLAYLQSES